VSVLLPGDVEAAGEASFAARRSEVVKVPHHGSRTSSTRAFVEGARPRLALVSAGFRNPFGHPHREVLERYAQSGALILRTDQDGAITASTDGSRLWVTSHRNGSAVIRPARPPTQR
jgi:competence protein ComEC